MCRLQFYRNMQKKSTNPSIRTLVSFLQCRLLRVFRILPYAHQAKAQTVFFCFFVIHHWPTTKLRFRGTAEKCTIPPKSPPMCK